MTKGIQITEAQIGLLEAVDGGTELRTSTYTTTVNHLEVPEDVAIQGNFKTFAALRDRGLVDTDETGRVRLTERGEAVISAFGI